MRQCVAGCAYALSQSASSVERGLNVQSTLFDLRPVLRPLGALLSFEAVFVFFLISINYKSDPRFSWIPVDSTILFFILGAVMGLAIVWREGIYLPGLTVVSLLMIFIVWALLSGLWTPSDIYAQEKLFKLATLNLWSVIATAMIIANRRERVRRFLVLVLVLGTAAALDTITRYGGVAQYDPAPNVLSTNDAFSANFYLENYLGQGRFYGMGALVAFAAWLRTSPYSKPGMVLMAAFAICFVGLLVIGSRGPTLGVLAGMMLPLALGLRFADRRLLASKALVASFVLLAVLIVALWQGAQYYSDDLRTLQRLNVLFTEEAGRQGGRLRFWRDSWHLWIEQPIFGSGIGSWPMRHFGLDVSRHPHNLVLEVLVEFGLIGLFLLAAACAAAARHISARRLREDPLLMCAAMLSIQTFLYAMTSSDITENRYFFAMLALFVMRSYRRTSRITTESRVRDLEPAAQRRSGHPQGMPIPGRSKV
jgi:O-antigen ligase